MHTTLLWLRNDLRLTDNPALEAAVQSERLVPVYIHDPQSAGAWAPGAASNWWLHHSLAALDQDLRQLGSRLILRAGPTATILQELVKASKADRVCWNRRYEPNLTAMDSDLKTSLQGGGVEVQSFNAGLLFEPWQIMRDAGSHKPAPYKVFTAYWRACVRHGLHGVRHASVKSLPKLPGRITSAKLEDLDLLPQIPWDKDFRQHWQPGESGALARLDEFLDDALPDYRDGRDRPSVAGTSRLSAHLHFGEIGPRQIIQALLLRDSGSAGRDLAGVETFEREVGWREFAHYLLFHFPHTDRKPLNARFENFPWRDDYAADLAAWQRGSTGIPLVDAGMRELWHTGWMHNRVRMVVASFLTKNLMIPWQEGAAWFWDTLVDADLASNSMGWQWVAGSGADAAPYFRIFNPVLQGEKFDPEGSYVRRWVPELNGLPKRYIHKPWAAPADLQPLCAGYPAPLLDLKRSRERALAAYKQR